MSTVEVDSSKIFLRSVETLSLEKEKMTSNRRENPIPQVLIVSCIHPCTILAWADQSWNARSI